MRNPIDGSEIGLKELFGTNCFSNSVMRERLPKSVYNELVRVQSGNGELTLSIAEVVASAMREWAIEKGATHYTHWFHPLSGLSAEKHEAFISPIGDGRVLMEFSGKELVKGEPDASSFPSGGLRATFEARGYTAWDVTSPAFLKTAPDRITLCIPTAFVSYYGQALDKKVPLLKSMEAINKASMRVLRALGNSHSLRAMPSVGPEQEYFLVSDALYKKRPDLMLAGRTVFGSMPAKGQEMEDHYYGAIEEKVTSFMNELNTELWAMGVCAKTQHNEVAPNQFELASIYASANVAADANQLIMETMRKVAGRHGMACLLHEKPFAGVNGSGKHINWSIATDDGINLLEPGTDAASDARFLLFVTAIIEAVDKRAALLRASAATAGNDHRLGGHEAPPSVISIFLGDPLTELLDAVAENRPAISSEGSVVELGHASLPKLPKDFSDRNRTSPFAFTGNKFEFRMVASSQSAATPTTMLNAAVAEVLAGFADRLEHAAVSGADTMAEIRKIIAESYKAHRRVVFNGNGYSAEWALEAERRGLPRSKSAVDVIPEFASASTVALLSKLGILTKEESESRCVIYLERYAKQVNIEAGLMVDLSRRAIFPAVCTAAENYARAASVLAGVGAISTPQEARAQKIAVFAAALVDETDRLEKVLNDAQKTEDPLAKARAYRESVIPHMDSLRGIADDVEKLVPNALWPLPSYEELLFTL
jgi:glutamine synthetase